MHHHGRSIWLWNKVQHLPLAHGCACKVSLIIVVLLLYSYLLMSRAIVEPPAKEKVWEHYVKSRQDQHNTSLKVSRCTQTHLATSDSASPIPQIII